MLKATCIKCANELMVKENIAISMKCPKCSGSIFKLSVHYNISQIKPVGPPDEEVKESETQRISRAK